LSATSPCRPAYRSFSSSLPSPFILLNLPLCLPFLCLQDPTREVVKSETCISLQQSRCCSQWVHPYASMIRVSYPHISPRQLTNGQRCSKFKSHTVASFIRVPVPQSLLYARPICVIFGGVLQATAQSQQYSCVL
jgi:hypothetical protein